MKYLCMKETPSALWNKFKQALSEELTDTPLEQLEKAWEEKRTTFYRQVMIPAVADRMNLIFKDEKLNRVDYVLYKKAANGYEIPVIAIESENDCTRCEEEVEKLCCLNLPLKVLFLAMEWNDATRQEQINDSWQYIFAANNEVYKLDGYFGFVIWNSLDSKFHCFAFNEEGEIIDQDQVLHDCYCTSADTKSVI